MRDDEVAKLALRHRRTPITCDLDFGRLYDRGRGTFGVIILRLVDQTVESVNRALARFFREDAAGVALDASLVVLDEERRRVVRTP